MQRSEAAQVRSQPQTPSHIFFNMVAPSWPLGQSLGSNPAAFTNNRAACFQQTGSRGVASVKTPDAELSRRFIQTRLVPFRCDAIFFTLLSSPVDSTSMSKGRYTTRHAGYCGIRSISYLKEAEGSSLHWGTARVTPFLPAPQAYLVTLY